MSELLQLCYNHPVLFAVFSMNKCPSDAVLCTTHLLAVPNVTGLDSGPTMLTALLVQQLYGLPITTLEEATSQARVHPGFNVSDRLITLTGKWREHDAGYEWCVNILYRSFTSIFPPMFLSNLHAIAVVAPLPRSVSLVRRIWLHSDWPHTRISFTLFIELHAALLILENQRGIGLKHNETFANIPNCSICTVVSIMLYFTLVVSSLFSVLQTTIHTHTLSGHTWAYTTLVLVNF